MKVARRLEPDEELSAIQAAQAGRGEALEVLICAHRPLIISLSKRLCSAAELSEELHQAGCIGLIQAIRHYDAGSQVRLITYAVPWILGEMKRTLRAMQAQVVQISIDEQTEIAGKERIDLSSMDLRFALEQLQSEEQLLVFLRFFRDKTQKETALLLGKSQSQISKLEQRALSRLRDMLA